MIRSVPLESLDGLVVADSQLPVEVIVLMEKAAVKTFACLRQANLPIAMIIQVTKCIHSSHCIQ
jgi:hypothetical protein